MCLNEDVQEGMLSNAYLPSSERNGSGNEGCWGRVQVDPRSLSDMTLFIYIHHLQHFPII